MPLRVGCRPTRASVAEAARVAELLRAGGIGIAVVPIATDGDLDHRSNGSDADRRRAFSAALEEALREGRIDVAVHAGVDIPARDPQDLRVGAFPRRADPRIALCGQSILRPGMRIGTDDPLLAAQLHAHSAELEIEPLRGSVDARLRKRGERGLDAVLLPCAALDRLGLAGEAGARFDPAEMLPPAGSGAVALQVRAGEELLVSRVDDAPTRARVQAERACLAIFQDTRVPAAVHHSGATLTALAVGGAGEIVRRSGDDPEDVAPAVLRAL